MLEPELLDMIRNLTYGRDRRRSLEDNNFTALPPALERGQESADTSADHNHSYAQSITSDNTINHIFSHRLFLIAGGRKT